MAPTSSRPSLATTAVALLSLLACPFSSSSPSLAAAQESLCDLVESQSTINLVRSPQPDYLTAQTEYWSTACGDLKPSCILLPETADEVAALVSLLNNGDNTTSFAVKSGGHNPNEYFASVDGGPLISTKNLNEVVLDASAETVRVGPGNRWDDVSAALDGSGYTVVGGRIGNVGVGGYILGGGLSFMSTQYGWASNSVLEYTVVLANATIVRVTPQSHPDVHTALTAGGNNFGIVTSFLLRAHPMEDQMIWGGNYIFSADVPGVAENITRAVRDFVEYYPDEKAGIIVTAERTLATLVDLWIVFLYYNGPEPPEGVFGNFSAVGPHIDTTKTQSYNDLLAGNNWAVVKGSVYAIGTETVPLPSAEGVPSEGGNGTVATRDGATALFDLYETWKDVSDQVKFVPGLIASIAFQPAPRMLGAAARRQAEAIGASSTDLIALDEETDRIIFEFNYSFLSSANDDAVSDVMEETYAAVAEARTQWEEEGLVPAGTYNPLFLNDAFHRQDYFGRLRPEMKELAERVRGELDPEGLWRDRTGGPKI